MPRFRPARSARALLALAIATFAVGLSAGRAHATADASWSDVFGIPGPDGEVLCATVWHGNLVLGGNFGQAGTIQASEVALWDGTRWSAMGAGLDNIVEALAVWNDSLYAAGSFGASGATSLNHVARWTGSAWVDVGGGVNGEVTSLLAAPAGLVVGGAFNDTPSLSGTNNVALWNGHAWVALSGGLDGTVHALALDGALVAAGGEFSGRVATFGGGFWSVVGGGLPDGTNPTVVDALVSHAGVLYAGGAFDPTVGGSQLLNLAAWTGTQWQPVDGGVDGTVHALTEWNGNVYLAGEFMNPVFHFAEWDGLNLSYPAGVYGVGWYGGDYVDALAPGATKLYLGGVLTEVHPSTFGTNVFAFDGTGYASLGAGNGLDGEVRAIGKWNGSIVVGGAFGRSYTTGGLSGMASWSGSQWAPLGAGLQSAGYYWLRVNGLTTFGTDLVACGQFFTSGATAVNNIARWNGTTWGTYAQGFRDEVYATAVYGGQLWAAGGGQDQQSLAAGQLWRWTGSAWQSMANDVIGFAMTTWNGKLVLGGAFNTVAGVPANDVATWNGTSWSALGAGFDGPVLSFAVYNGDLVAAGEFSHSGSAAVAGLARWNGTQWVPVGGPVTTNWAAFGLATGASALWAGGSWDQIGSTTGLDNVARWDGAAWAPLGSGTAGYVHALYVDGTDVWVGGALTSAGQKLSLRIARWSAATADIAASARPLALALAAPRPNPARGATNLAFTLPARREVRLDIVDAAGRRVATLAHGVLDAGPHLAAWDGRVVTGAAAPAGVYWAVLSAGAQRLVRSLVRLP